MMLDNGKQFGLAYLTPATVEEYLARHEGYILGVIGFGNHATLSRSPTSVWVDTPALGEGNAILEVWNSSTPVFPCDHQGLNGTSDGNILFGSLVLQQDDGDTLQALAKQAYTRIFGFIDHHHCPHLLRVWHYFPQINEHDDSGLERYRGFNIGRHEAFVEYGRNIGEEGVPAASALGSHSGSLTIYFLASKQPGRAVDNPRQVSAYNYPQSFGPRSPVFVRAMSAAVGTQRCFFISGTASIVGYETVHQGNIERQTAETLLNIRTLLQQEPDYDAKPDNILLKIYLRNLHDLDFVRTRVSEEFGPLCQTVYLHSNICRSDLLLEIEGACFTDTK